MDSKYAFSFMDGRGDVFIIGIIVNSGVKYIINRQITFTYQKKLNHYLMKNTHLDFFNDDDQNSSEINRHLPDFFTRKGGELAMNVTEGAFGNPVFTVTDTPVFLCDGPSDG
ncbi:hypothetical protein [Tenebrionicola larvae]|jgi:hypothetical protein|uniref:Uncharacterized protein n=3 Tax=Tenebrionibacter/Tenebrionicola group TaxID=2969848 RepID=A0A8K0V521_9ENTR|nr:hypothetical protein [Tenebrionicola larvae]MBK4716936.1 hypothetical protein [Tenebrionibacter intestinalis]MBV5097438.1 hypothetical protein [Tenebrionicola larvae]